jgi:predicted transcriptional regulator
MPVKQKRIRWTASIAADVVAHRVYVAKDPDMPTYSSLHVEVAMPKTEVLAPNDFPAGTFSEDVVYNIGITAVDDVGNESNMEVASSPFDFIAPDAPTNVIIEDA